MARPHTINWQRRRSEFNHDWLKNRYLLSLGTWLNILADEVEDRELEAIFVPELLPEWEAHRGEAFELIEGFESSMSPRALFERPPLREWDHETRHWLGELVHLLWLARKPVHDWVARAHKAAAEADAAYRRLGAQLAGSGEAPSLTELRLMAPSFLEFYNCCQHLTECISQFPSRIDIA